jgi:thiamine biosynthesis lipoprotein
LQRAQPYLGTIVSIGIRGMTRGAAMEACDQGFASVAMVHRLMSFHQPGSDVDRLNCHALDGPVGVSEWTMQVLRCALQLAAESDGAFDITVARELVARGVLPRPRSRRDAEPGACWRDIELIGTDEVRFHRPLWIDLGGIAKGFAVDQAMASMPIALHAQVCVNAGGDLRVCGPDMHPVYLRVAPADGLAPVVMIRGGSLASSSGIGGEVAHLHGTRRTPMGKDCFVSVLTEQCMLADALTKIVMAMPAQADPILCSYGASAHLYREQAWHTLGLRA